MSPQVILNNSLLLNLRVLWKLDVHQPRSLHKVFISHDAGIDEQCCLARLNWILVFHAVACCGTLVVIQLFQSRSLFFHPLV